MRGPKSAEHTAKLRAVLTSARTSRLKADQKARERFLRGSVQFGYRLGDDGELVPHELEQEAIREMLSLKAQGRSLRAIAAEMQARGHQISHVGVQGALKALRAA
jgi:putative DNA-invertase from lambdoid prophage Rac